MSSQHPRLFADQTEQAEFQLRLTVVDPDTIQELSMVPEGEPREKFALTALRIGVMAMRHGVWGASWRSRVRWGVVRRLSSAPSLATSVSPTPTIVAG